MRTEFPQGLDMYPTNRHMRGKFAQFPHRPDPQKTFSPVQQIFEGLVAYLPDFSAFKRRRSTRTVVAG